MRTAMINVRTDPEVKEKVTAILKRIGITTSEAVNLFLNRVIMERGIPFDVKIPNDETIKAMEDIEDNRNLTEYETVDEMFKDLEIEDHIPAK